MVDWPFVTTVLKGHSIIYFVTDSRIWLYPRGRGFVKHPLSMAKWNVIVFNHILQSFEMYWIMSAEQETVKEEVLLIHS